MPRARRATALLVNLLLAHAMWVGNGLGCALPGMGSPMEPSRAAAEGAGTDMAGMDMAGMDMAGMDMADQAGTEQGGAPSDRTPFRFPWSSDNCQSLTLCAPLALAAQAQPLGPPVAAPAAVVPHAVLMPPSRTIAPELPPPRA